jgi:hypothetical protein
VTPDQSCGRVSYHEPHMHATNDQLGQAHVIWCPGVRKSTLQTMTDLIDRLKDAGPVLTQIKVSPDRVAFNILMTNFQRAAPNIGIGNVLPSGIYGVPVVFDSKVPPGMAVMVNSDDTLVFLDFNQKDSTKEEDKCTTNTETLDSATGITATGTIAGARLRDRLTRWLRRVRRL